MTTRLLPTLYLKWRSQGFVLAALDVADAFLTVPQRTPTVVTCTTASGQSWEYALGKVLPGQRDGGQLWCESITELLERDLGVKPCPAYPCLLKSSCGRCVMLLHVDDILCLVHEDFLQAKLLPTFEARYKVAVEVMREPGDEICFLKRTHMLRSEHEMVSQGHPKHLEHLFEILKIARHLKPKKVPGHPSLEDIDGSEDLNAKDAKTYRSAVGVLLSTHIDRLCRVPTCNSSPCATHVSPHGDEHAVFETPCSVPSWLC